MTVIERPTAQFGSEIWISYLDQTVFHTFLSPARSRAKDQSREVVQAVRENIDIINAQRKFIQNADLGPEEM
jgi:curli production assembly/transport component CsgE